MDEWILVSQKGFLTTSPEGLYWGPARDRAHPFDLDEALRLFVEIPETRLIETKGLVCGAYVQVLPGT
jgi:hypothetical protein